jgi:hypothetical protein
MTEEKLPAWRVTSYPDSVIKVDWKFQGEPREAFASPYDVPEAIRGYRLADTNNFIIEMKYIVEDEDRKTIKQNDHISLQLGKASGRLYAIIFDPSADIIDRVSDVVKLKWTAVDRTFKTIIKVDPKSPRIKNYELVRRAILDKRADLVKA